LLFAMVIVLPVSVPAGLRAHRRKRPIKAFKPH
jgi:hypothetical protein